MSEVRSSFIGEICKGERSIAAICRERGVSRPTAYKWLRRYESGLDMEGMSRMPLRSPNRTPADVEDVIVRARLRYPCWGGRKLKAYLEREERVQFPAASTITAILHRNGLISPEASQAATPYKRFERSAPNELWQTDFKGNFDMLDGTRCHPLTVLDDHSRYSLCISAKDNERFGGVVESFLAMFREYGLPDAVLCDNGSPWGTPYYTAGYTRFEVFLMNYGILPIHCRPFRPQTQGKEERFNRTLKRELLAQERMRNLSHAQERFDAFRKEYNEVRPHCTLNYAVPADRYRNSDRVMPTQIREWEYPQGAEIRSIRRQYLHLKGLKMYFSEAFEGCNVALMASKEDGVVDVVYRNFRVAQVNLREKCLTSKRIARIECAD